MHSQVSKKRKLLRLKHQFVIITDNKKQVAVFYVGMKIEKLLINSYSSEYFNQSNFLTIIDTTNRTDCTLNALLPTRDCGNARSEAQ